MKVIKHTCFETGVFNGRMQMKGALQEESYD